MKAPNLFLGILIFIFFLSGCKKKETDPEPTTKPTAKQVQSDQSGSNAIDGVIDDVNDIVNNKKEEVVIKEYLPITYHAVWYL